MNRRILIISFVTFLSAHLCFAQSSRDYSDISNQVEQLSLEVNSLKAQKKTYDAETRQLKAFVAAQQTQIDSLRQAINANEREIEATRQASVDSIGATHKHIEEATTKLSSAMNTKHLYAIALGLIALIVAICIYFTHRRKAKEEEEQIGTLVSNLAKMESMSSELDNKIVSVDSKLLDIIEKQLSIAEKVNGGSNEVDHSLAIAVANELVRIQQNLNHMDPAVKGVSQLKNRANAILSTLNSKQYSIPNMLGRVYHEGDTIIATMELNEEMEVGTNRIKRVIKPQVSYAGKLIQPAEVVVEFNE